MLEPGNGSLKGVMRYSQRGGSTLADRLWNMLDRTTIVADREWVELFPVSGHMEQMIATYDMARADGIRPHVHVEAAKFPARALTDREGDFEFHGLKPGRYFISGRIPFTATTVTRVDTGQRNISYSPMFGTGSVDPVYRNEYGSVADEQWVTAIVEVKPGAATVFAP